MICVNKVNRLSKYLQKKLIVALTTLRKANEALGTTYFTDKHLKLLVQAKTNVISTMKSDEFRSFCDTLAAINVATNMEETVHHAVSEVQTCISLMKRT